MTRQNETTPVDDVGAGFTRWRDEARQLAGALRAACYLGPVLVNPTAAERIARMLIEAEPPGTGAQQVAAGYEAGVAHGKQS